MSRIKRYEGLVTSTLAINYVEKSIKSVEKFYSVAGDPFGDYLEKLNLRENLKSLISELIWRYGSKKVMFKFTKKKSAPSETAISLSEILLNSDDHADWVERVFIDEAPNDKSYTKVYIRF